MNLTPHQRAVLRAIAELEKSPSPYLPTLGEVAKACHITRTGVHYHVQALRAAGALSPGNRRAGLITTKAGRREALRVA